MSKIDWSKPVQTRDGRPVRILCTDAAGSSYFIIGLFTEKGVERIERWDREGIAYSHGELADLINIPTKREGWIAIGKSPPSPALHPMWGARWGNPVAMSSPVYATPKEAADRAPEGVDWRIMRIEWEE